MAVGQRFTARFQPPGSRGSTLRPRFTVVEPGRRLVWLGHVLVRGVFDGEHEFILERTAEGTTLVTQTERFRGVLAPLFRGTIDRSRDGFLQLNAALADRAAGSVR